MTSPLKRWLFFRPTPVYSRSTKSPVPLFLPPSLKSYHLSTPLYSPSSSPLPRSQACAPRPPGATLPKSGSSGTTLPSATDGHSSLGERAFGCGRWTVLAPLGISDCRSHISDLRFEICHLKSQRACPQPHSRPPLPFSKVAARLLRVWLSSIRKSPSLFSITTP